MYTYELTPNLKTKSYRVLDNGVEIARSLAKKTAKIFCETYNTLLNKTNQSNDTIKHCSEVNCADRISENDAASDCANIGDNNAIVSGDTGGISPERQERFANAFKQLSTLIENADASAAEHGRRAKEHGRRAKEHGRRAAEHGRRAAEHGRNAAEHGRNAALIDDLIKRLDIACSGTSTGDAEFGAYSDVPCQLHHEAGSVTVLREDGDSSFRTIDTTATIDSSDFRW
jgi:phosphoribosylpyrophosphate synthetase